MYMNTEIFVLNVRIKNKEVKIMDGLIKQKYDMLTAKQLTMSEGLLLGSIKRLMELEKALKKMTEELERLRAHLKEEITLFG